MAAAIVTWAVAFVSRGFPCFTPTLDPSTVCRVDQHTQLDQSRNEGETTNRDQDDCHDV